MGPGFRGGGARFRDFERRFGSSAVRRKRQNDGSRGRGGDDVDGLGAALREGFGPTEVVDWLSLVKRVGGSAP